MGDGDRDLQPCPVKGSALSWEQQEDTGEFSDGG